MKNIAKFVAVLAGALLLALTALPTAALAAGIEIIGEEAGLVLVPSGGSLFALDNMNPGDTRETAITLRNNYSTWYHLWIQTEEIAADDPSLFEVMELTVNYRGEVLYQGPVDGFAGELLYLGRLQPGDSEEMLVAVHLPGPETGNEYQGKSASAKWVFTAQASEEVVVEPEDPELEPDDTGVDPEKPGLLPQTFGEGVLYLLFLAGLLLLLLGVPLYRRHRQRS